MRQRLERLRAEEPLAAASTPVLKVGEVKRAMDRVAKEVEMTRITHHDLWHLFAKRCIERGVDIPTVSRGWGTRMARRCDAGLRSSAGAHSQAMSCRGQLPLTGRLPCPTDNPRRLAHASSTA
jgi:hypothetical protein